MTDESLSREELIDTIKQLRRRLEEKNHELRVTKADVTRLKQLNSELAWKNIDYRIANKKLSGEWPTEEDVEEGTAGTESIYE